MVSPERNITAAQTIVYPELLHLNPVRYAKRIFAHVYCLPPHNNIVYITSSPVYIINTRVGYLLLVINWTGFLVVRASFDKSCLQGNECSSC